MRADPPVRKDGLCVVCEKPRKMPKPQKGVDPAVYARDPYCSSACCRAYHGVPLVTVIGGNSEEKRGRHERVAA